MAQRDAALEAFDGLRVREVVAWSSDTTSTFLAKFQTTAASLEPDRRIKLVVAYAHGLELLKAALSDPQANKICALRWVHHEKEDMNLVIPLLTDNRPELALLQVSFQWHSAFDFVSSVLERPSNKIKVLGMPPYEKGDLSRFFAALGQSQVSAFAINGCESLEFYQGLCEYLARDLLVRLKVRRVPLEVMKSLATCTCLIELGLTGCKFSEPTVFASLPKSTTKLVLSHCTFVGGVDWSLLADRNVRELSFKYVGGVDENQLGNALTVYLRAKGLDELCFDYCNFSSETLVAVGVELGRIKRLETYGTLNDASIELIALVLRSPNCKMKELTVEYNGSTKSSIEDLLAPALRHPNCNLAKLRFDAHKDDGKVVRRMEDTFRNRRALFALLQGQQVRRLYCPLRRLPVEMFRLVGLTLS